jgi:two-component system chemotaxis response regulator CheB
VAGFRPSVDHLFDSCARAYGSELAAVLLTGMGQDGVEGLRTVRQRGGHVLAQDERSSVVFGMAQQAVKQGLVDEVLPLDAIGARLQALVDGATK